MQRLTSQMGMRSFSRSRFTIPSSSAYTCPGPVRSSILLPWGLITSGKNLSSGRSVPSELSKPGPELELLAWAASSCCTVAVPEPCMYGSCQVERCCSACQATRILVHQALANLAVTTTYDFLAILFARPSSCCGMSCGCMHRSLTYHIHIPNTLANSAIHHARLDSSSQPACTNRLPGMEAARYAMSGGFGAQS